MGSIHGISQVDDGYVNISLAADGSFIGFWNEGIETCFAQNCSDHYVGFTLSGTYIETPLPAAFPLFATGLGMLGVLGWRRKRKLLP